MKPLFLVVLFGIVTMTSGCRLIAHFQYKKTIREAPFDVVIVPGFPYKEEQEKIGLIHRLRILWAFHLIEMGITKNVIFSGGAVHTPYVESEIMAQYARSLGIPDEKIFVESMAEHSTENLFYGYALALKLGFKQIAVATDPFQAQLIKRNTTQDELDVYYLRAKATWLLRKTKHIVLTLNDPLLAYQDNFTPLAERISEEELKLGTAGERFRKRYNLQKVTADDLIRLDFTGQQ